MLNFTREETIARLFSLTARGIKYDLDRMLIAVRRLGNPQSACRSFHVAGTNGKGSTCAFIASILRAHGHRVGLYTSPHIIDFEERFIIDGRPVATEAWMAVYQAIEPAIADLNLTFFEITSIICFELFKRERVDYAVFETGMGGRLDATNVVTPVASVVTSIGIDHAEYLGPDLLSISREKLGIVKPGVPLVMIRSPEETIMRLASETCERLGSLLHVVEERQATGIVEEECRCSFTAAGVRYRLPLAGRFQIVNALAAIEACRIAGLREGRTMAAGVEQTFLPGRFQEFAVAGKTVIFDVAHNPQAAGVLANTLRTRFAGRPVTVVIGAMKDKDIRGILSALRPVADRFFFTQPAIDRACPAADLPMFLPDGPRPSFDTITGVGGAIGAALRVAAGPICVCGSFYTVAEAMAALHIAPFGGGTLAPTDGI